MFSSNIRALHNQFCDYASTFKGHTWKTIQWYRDGISSFLTFQPVQEISEITQASLETWILKGKKERKWAPKTIRERLKSINLFLEWARKRAFIAENPAQAIDLPRIPKRIPVHLTLDKAKELMSWTRNYPYAYPFEAARAFAIISTFLYTGVRKSELRNFELRDLDLENKVVMVRNGKGQKDRIIPMETRLIPILEKYLVQRDRLKKTNPFFFVSMRSDTQMGDTIVAKLVEKLRNASGIYFSPHMLRHTFAVLMLEGGCDLFSLCKMMGHSDIKTTTIYLTATTKLLQEQIRKHPLS